MFPMYWAHYADVKRPKQLIFFLMFDLKKSNRVFFLLLLPWSWFSPLYSAFSLVRLWHHGMG